MIKLRVTSIATIFEPSTAGSATAPFTGFLGGAALGTPAATAFRRYTGRSRYFCVNRTSTLKQYTRQLKLL